MSSRSNICTWRVLYRRQPFGNPERSGVFFPTKNIRGKREVYCQGPKKVAGTGRTLPHGAAGAGPSARSGSGTEERQIPQIPVCVSLLSTPFNLHTSPAREMTLSLKKTRHKM